mgnify:CR=1 FL=1|jgi:hypothetical protein
MSLLRWVCENCDTVNEVNLLFFTERAEACGDEEVCYSDICHTCHRGVYDVREQPKPEED